MGGGRSVRKGKVGEREVVHLLRDVFPGVERGYHQAHRGSKSCDVEGSPFWIEAKCSARPNPAAALAQAIAKVTEVGDPRPPLALTVKRSRSARGEPWLATMRASDLLALLQELQELRLAASIEVGEGGGSSDSAALDRIDRAMRRVLDDEGSW